jgi:hypothetical protein
MASPNDPLPPEDEAEFLFASLRYLTSVVPEIKEESLPKALLRKYLGTINAANEKRIRALSLTQAEELVITASGFRTNKEFDRLAARPKRRR